MDLPDIGPIVMEDAETGEQLYVDYSRQEIPSAFKEAAQKRADDLTQTFKRSGVDALRSPPRKTWSGRLCALQR